MKKVVNRTANDRRINRSDSLSRNTCFASDRFLGATFISSRGQPTGVILMNEMLFQNTGRGTLVNVPPVKRCDAGLRFLISTNRRLIKPSASDGLLLLVQ